MHKYNRMSKSQSNLGDLSDSVEYDKYYQVITTESKRYERPDLPPPLPQKQRPRKSNRSTAVSYTHGEESVTFERRQFRPTPPQAAELLLNSRNPDLLKRKALDKKPPNQNVEVRRNHHKIQRKRYSGCSICYWFCLITMYLLICVTVAFLVLHVFRPRALIGIGISFEHKQVIEFRNCVKIHERMVHQVKILDSLLTQFCFEKEAATNDTDYKKICVLVFKTMI